MLFLGLGTGLGSAMIADGVLEPMELGHLPYRKGKTFEAPALPLMTRPIAQLPYFLRR